MSDNRIGYVGDVSPFYAQMTVAAGTLMPDPTLVSSVRFAVRHPGGETEWWNGIVSSTSATAAVFRHTLVSGDFDAAGEYEWVAFATIGGTERRVSDPERFVVKTRPSPT